MKTWFFQKQAWALKGWLIYAKCDPYIEYLNGEQELIFFPLT